MGHPYWPLFDLRLRIGNVELRPTADADLGALAGFKPHDVELDPARPAYGIDSRASWTLQSYWRSVGNWRPESWNLEFSVFAAGTLVGVQCLEAENFARLRTVDSSSWLVGDARGRGIGTAMRLAVLHLAFDGLDARLAVTEAWRDNRASLGVSRALGYVDNGWYLHAREGSDEPSVMQRMRLTREDFRARHADRVVTIDSLAPCLPFFGLGTEV